MRSVQTSNVEQISVEHFDKQSPMCGRVYRESGVQPRFLNLATGHKRAFWLLSHDPMRIALDLHSGRGWNVQDVVCRTRHADGDHQGYRACPSATTSKQRHNHSIVVGVMESLKIAGCQSHQCTQTGLLGFSRHNAMRPEANNSTVIVA
ncbi:hypothetical protein KC326_g30 [Hortaea werneckii]|nr:hypothetical protein KC326_g30 [Hortaea werneckii]